MNPHPTFDEKGILAIDVLDHGFIALRNVSGPTRRIDFAYDADDTDPANTARISFEKFNSERTREDDLKLCEYLMKNWHTSPFEMIEVWLEMKMPIFLARQFIRHRTASVNECSGRYVKLPAEWYIPEVVGGKAKSAKQGQEDNLSDWEQKEFKGALNNHCEMGYRLYEEALDRGVAPEHARMALSLNHYTHWVWKQDLHNLMHLMALRLDSHAQIEAQAYAQGIYTILKQVLPESMKLFDKYRRKLK